MNGVYRRSRGSSSAVLAWKECTGSSQAVSSSAEVLKSLLKSWGPADPTMPDPRLPMGLINITRHYYVQGLRPEHCRFNPNTFSTGKDVPRLHRPSAEQLREYALRNEPVVLTGLFGSKDWPVPASTSWSDAHIIHRAGNREIKVRRRDGAIETLVPGVSQRKTFGDATRENTYDFVQVSLAEFIENAQTTGSLYAGRVPLDELPELRSECIDPDKLPIGAQTFGEPYKDGVIMYFGAGGQTTPLHYDQYENLLYVIRGGKHLLLFPTCASPFLYPKNNCGAYFYSQVPSEAVARLADERFPLLSQAQGCHREVVVQEGECLYLPPFWWHLVTGIGSNLTLNYWYLLQGEKRDPQWHHRRGAHQAGDAGRSGLPPTKVE